MVVAQDADGDVATVEGAQIRRARPADLAATRTVLARALAHDPLMDWIFGLRADRSAAVAAFLWGAIEEYVLAGNAWLAVDDRRAVGAAAWRVPGTEAAGADGGPALPGPSTLGLLLPADRVVLVREGFAAMHGLLPDEPHALLHFLGVDADRRGFGLGAALVEAGLARVPDHLPAHVNTTLESNVAFYVARGFTHVGGVRLGPRGPLMHGLRRAARHP